MEKQTRMSKYKDLRSEMMEEVSIHHSETKEVVEDDDFLAFIPKKQQVKIEDTLQTPLTYETLDKDDEGVRSAITHAKANVGKDQYNTRLDILSKIKGEDFSEPKVEEKKAPAKKMSLLEKLASMSPEEDVKELEKFQQQEQNKEEEKGAVEEDKPVPPVKEEPKEEPVNDKPQKKKKELFIEAEDSFEEDEKESKIVTVLNYVIIGFMLVFIGLVCIIVKDMIF